MIGWTVTIGSLEANPNCAIFLSVGVGALLTERAGEQEKKVGKRRNGLHSFWLGRIDLGESTWSRMMATISCKQNLKIT